MCSPGGNPELSRKLRKQKIRQARIREVWCRRAGVISTPVARAWARRLLLSGNHLSELRQNFKDFNATVLRPPMTSAILLGTCPGYAGLAHRSPSNDNRARRLIPQPYERPARKPMISQRNGNVPSDEPTRS